jgi:mono/diheme cytochrome c family protein
MRALFYVSVCTCLSSIGCMDGEARSQSADTSDMPPYMVFRLHCSQCHGDGTGNGHRLATLKGKPKDMTSRQWQDQVTDEHLFRVISEGGGASKLHNDMPSWKLELSKEKISGLVEFIRTLDDEPNSVEPAQQNAADEAVRAYERAHPVNTEQP